MGKKPEKIDELVWEYRNTDHENDKNRMGYAGGSKMKINKAKFRINQIPENWKQTSVTITGQVNTPQGNKTLTFEDERAEVIGNYVITHPMSANTHLAKKRTQFFNPMTIEWSVKYKSTGGLPKTKTLGVSRHKIYVTLNKPSQELGKLYLSLLHWATSNPGATTKPKVVQKTWQHFASKKLTAWDGKRKFFYYKIGGLSAGDRPSNCLISSIPYAACGDFADLLIDSLMVNHAEVGSQVIFVSPYRDQKMLIKEWIPISTTPTVISDKGYKWKFSLYKGHDGKGSMVSSKGKGFPNNKYGDLLNLNGISGQNIETPVEKVFSSHTIVKLPSNSLPPELVDTPYFDPSYGVTYRDEEDFENKAVYGYAKEIERTGEIIQYEVREKPVPNLPHNIQFEVDMKF